MADNSIDLALLVGKRSNDEFIKKFFFHPICLKEELNYSQVDLEKAAIETLNILDNTSIELILDIIGNNIDEIPNITTANIPQFSNIMDVEKIPQIVAANYGCTYTLIGYFFNKNGKSTAQWKYGENHYKIAAQMGLTTHEEPFQVTYLGKEYVRLSDKQKNNICAKLCLRIPIIQMLLTRARKESFYGMKILREILSEKTAARRRSSIKMLINQVVVNLPDNVQKEILANIIWK